MRIARYFASCLTCLPLLAQSPSFTVAQGTAANALEVRTFSETAPLGPGKLVVKDLEFLPIEMTNRNAQHQLRQDRTRRLTQEGLVRLELPGNGRLLHYRLRGGDRYGFLLVLGDGSALVVLELAGTGVTGKDDPFQDRCAVAPDGKAAAFLTLAGALWIARLDGQNYASTGQPARPVPGGTGAVLLSLCVGKNVLFFQNASRVWRCPLADNGAPVDVTPVPLPTVLKDLMAPSGDGASVVFLAGSSKTAMRLWHLQEAGTSLVLPPPASKFEEPTYLPEFTDGSRLQLSDDGTRLLYSDTSSRDEVFLLDVTGVTSAVAVTSDPNFQPYIGTIILPVFAADIVTLAIGDPGKLDLYTAATGQPAVHNATLTAGNTVRPWGVGALVPTAAFLGAGGQVHVVDRDATNLLSLRTIQPATATATLEVTGLTGTPVLGASWNDPADVLVPTASGDRLYTGLGFTPFFSSPSGIELSPTTHAPGSSYLALRASLPGVAHALVLFVPGVGLIGLPPESAPHGFAITVTGNLVLDTANGILFVSSAGVATLPTTGAARHLLSGAGA